MRTVVSVGNMPAGDHAGIRRRRFQQGRAGCASPARPPARFEEAARAGPLRFRHHAVRPSNIHGASLSLCPRGQKTTGEPGGNLVRKRCRDACRQPFIFRCEPVSPLTYRTRVDTTRRIRSADRKAVCAEFRVLELMVVENCSASRGILKPIRRFECSWSASWPARTAYERDSSMQRMSWWPSSIKRSSVVPERWHPVMKNLRESGGSSGSIFLL